MVPHLVRTATTVQLYGWKYGVACLFSCSSDRTCRDLLCQCCWKKSDTDDLFACYGNGSRSNNDDCLAYQVSACFVPVCLCMWLVFMGKKSHFFYLIFNSKIRYEADRAKNGIAGRISFCILLIGTSIFSISGFTSVTYTSCPSPSIIYCNMFYSHLCYLGNLMSTLFAIFLYTLFLLFIIACGSCFSPSPLPNSWGLKHYAYPYLYVLGSVAVLFALIALVYFVLCFLAVSCGLLAAGKWKKLF